MATLYVLSTPIGNLDDITLRALRVLSEVSVLACEDTRITPRILDRHDIPRPRTLFSCHEHNEERSTKRILGFLEEGVDVAFCSDAGSPCVSDPGYHLLKAVANTEHHIDVLPGPSAVHTALIASALPPSSYTFKGFSPPKSGARRRFFEAEKESAHTLIFFESPHRIAKSLYDAICALGNRDATVCTEMTKKFERVARGPLADLHAQFADKKTKGEVTIVIAGNNPKFTHPTPEGFLD